jgi:acyl-CoA dehydrogenase
MSVATRHADLRAEVRALCAGFPDEYWRRLDVERAYPQEFVDALTAAGHLAALIPASMAGGASASPRPA